MQEGVDTTNPESFAAAASSDSSTQYADAARSIVVAIAANRSTEVSAAAGSVVLTAYAQNNTQVAYMHTCLESVSKGLAYNTNELVHDVLHQCSHPQAFAE